MVIGADLSFAPGAPPGKRRRLSPPPGGVRRRRARIVEMREIYFVPGPVIYGIREKWRALVMELLNENTDGETC